jgi:hypothetical protein
MICKCEANATTNPILVYGHSMHENIFTLPMFMIIRLTQLVWVNLHSWRSVDGHAYPENIWCYQDFGGNYWDSYVITVIVPFWKSCTIYYISCVDELSYSRKERL